MRIGRLDLLRYGRFTNVSIELPFQNPDFQVVFGQNEAGKSTALTAIGDLLFGIPHNSPHNFIHDYATMRIGAVLERGNEVLEVHRRKGNKNTLLTPEQHPVPGSELALAPFLSGADRSFLERMFSLDHARLREGGREILEAQDEIGQMLFSAGAGLGGLRETLAALADEADGLWAPRRAARRKYFQAVDRLKAADDALRSRTVTAKQWQVLNKANDATQETYAELEQEIEKASAERRKLGRIRRVYRRVRRKAELGQTIAELGDVAVLPEDAFQTLQAADRDQTTATTRVETLTGQLEAAREERAKLNVDEVVILHQNDIEQLHEHRIKVRNGRADLPKRRAELASAEADFRRLVVELEWDADDVEQLIGRIPARAKVRVARTLLTRRGEHLSAVKSAQAAVEEVTSKAIELERQQEAQCEPLALSNLAAVVRATRKLGDLAARTSTAAADATDAQAEFQKLFTSLRPTVADEVTLGALHTPPSDTVQTHRDRCRDLDQHVQNASERIRTAARELDRQNNAYERLSSDEEAVAPEDLTLAREFRDTGWSLIRRRFVDGLPVPDEHIGEFVSSEHNLADAYQAAVHSADNLADLRFDKAEAAARLAVTARQIAEQKKILQSLHKEKESFAEEIHALNDAWQEMWSDVPFEPLAPDFMLEWLTKRNGTLSAAGQRASAERQVEELRRKEAKARSGVLDELTSLGSRTETLADQPLVVVLEAADDVLREHERAAAKRREIDDAHRQVTADVDRKRKVLESAKAEWSEWQGQWADALVALGLDTAASPEAVAAQIDAIDEMRTSVAKINDLRHMRIGKIEHDVVAFGRDVVQLTATVAPDLAQTEPEAAALQMEHRLAEAKRLQGLQEDKDDAIATLEKKIDDCESNRRESRESIRHLNEAAGVTETDQLRTAIDKSDQLRALQAEHVLLLDALLGDGDGLSVKELEDECETVDLDQASAHETSLQQELFELRERLLEVREQRTAARQAFEAVGGDDAAAQAAARRQEALADMRHVAEQYTRVRSAALLLQWTIDRYRREKQAPLLRHAGQLFATLTGGSFSRLDIDFDNRDHAHLIGVRPEGETVAISGMSTGTADQLYLALRIASIAEYLERAPALPFVADDLFVNFDDARAAAGFQVLGKLAKVTQVLFFTHHQHLVDIVQSTLGGSLSVLSLHDEPMGYVSPFQQA